MNRKGMTLTEIIISVAILASIGLTIVFGLNRVFNRQADDDQLSFEDKILSSTDLYLSNNQNLVNDLQTNKGWIIITVDDLTSAGFINENLIDPSTNEKILTNEEIKVSLDADGLYKIEYKPDDVKEPYLEGRTLNLHFKQNFDCTKISSYETEWKSVNLRAVGTDSLVMDVNIHDVIKSIKCNVDTSKPGTYEIEYTYELPDEYITKTYKRSVVVGGDPTDIEKIRAVIKPVAPDQVFIIRKPVDLTVYGTNRQGEERILNPSEYSVTGANTNTIGTKTATINYTGQNSDGSKPKTTVIFEVVYDPADIVSITASANPNPVIIRKSVTFTVQGTRRNGSKVTLNSSQYSVSSYSTSTVGSKLITISYTGTNSDGSKPTTPITLQVIYDPSDVTSLSMTVSPTTVIINKSVSFTVVGTRRNGTKVTLTSSQYSLSGHSTSTVGSKTATATYTGTNSDGSKPTATAKFTVVYDPEDIVSISASASPNPVIIHGTVSFTVTGTKRGGGTRSIPSSQYSISSYSTSTIGNKSITITYTGTNTDGSKPTRVITLQVIYNPLDVTSCTLTLSPNPVIIGNSMSATVVGTRRNGTTFTMTSGQYTLSGISTSTLGTRTGRATLNSTNSDGSKPYCTRNYTVNPSQNDIVSISASVSPNPVILNGSYSFTVIGTRRSGSTVTLNTSQYSHTAFSNTTTGTKSVTFTYTGTNSDGSKPSRTINVSVVANPLDVTSCTLTLSPNPVIIGNSMSATVVGKRRNGTTFTMSSSQYTLSGISTSTLGTRTGRATINSTNSDGSKASCTRSYTVNPSQNDIVSISASVSPNPVILNGSYSFTVIGTRRSGSTVTLNTSQYSRTAFSNTTTGTKSVTFTYTGTNSDGSKPKRTISVSVVANPLDVLSCTLILSPNPVIRYNPMSATVVGKRRNGTTFTMSASQYTLSGISTSTTGTSTGRATINATNSDGTKPSCTRSYTVNPPPTTTRRTTTTRGGGGGGCQCYYDSFGRPLYCMC